MAIVQETTNKVMSLLDSVYYRMCNKSYNDYILIIARGDIDPDLEKFGINPYVVDYAGDCYYDETREKFYVTYLQKRYSQEGFKYNGADGLFDLNIELMIYSHIWESIYMLKTLAHISDLLSGKQYDWKLRIPNKDIKGFIKERIIKPLISINDELGAFLINAYSPNLRNGFAHSLYDIDSPAKKIYLHDLSFDIDDDVQEEISFDVFQSKFLSSIMLSYYLLSDIVKIRNGIAEKYKGKLLTVPILLPNNKKIILNVDYKVINGQKYPLFRAQCIKEIVPKFSIGNWVLVGYISTPIEVESVENMETEQFVKLKDCTKSCNSKMLRLTTKPDIIDKECNDYKLIKSILS